MSDMKRCSKGEQCAHPDGPNLPANTEYFSRDARGKCGLRAECKACASKRAQKYYEENSKKIKEMERLRRLSNPEIVRAEAKRSAKKNRNRIIKYRRRWRENNIEAVRAYQREWQAAHPEYGRTSRRNRRAQNIEAEGKHSAADVHLQYDRQCGRCYYCHQPLNGLYHADHLIPLSRGGTNWPSNIVCACPKCNLSKGSKLPSEFSNGDPLL